MPGAGKRTRARRGLFRLNFGLSNGRCLRFDSGMDGDALTRLIRAVEAA